MIKPAIAKPLGLLNTPINEKRNPKNQRIKFPIGSQQKQKAMIASTNPAVPIPFFFFSWLMMIVCPCGAGPLISTSDIILRFDD